MQVLARVVEAGNFTKAADTQSMPKAVVLLRSRLSSLR